MELVAIAGGGAETPWELRRLTVFMLENLALRLPREDSPESLWLQARLALPASWMELHTRLARLERVHRGIVPGATTQEALGDFLHVAAQECKLTLARYLFKPEDVALRIDSLLRRSTAIPYWDMRGPEIAPHIAAYEKRILENLGLDGWIYWGADQTPSEMNSMVEYPLGTAVVVLKLPGSDVEFELKRAGMRGRQPLSVRYFRAAHRLYGGSPGTSSDAEARAAMNLVELYSGVHGVDPPTSTTLRISYVQSVPGWKGDTNLLAYLTDPEAFGPGYREMRAAMEDALAAFEGKPNDTLPGPVGATVRFLRFMPPRQALLKGSTSFRLDLLDDYLSQEGPDLYFHKGLGVECNIHDTRRFGADILEEILGVFEPPADPGETYGEFIANSLAVPSNRERADRFYLQHVRQTGLMLGTLAAVGGQSQGESFVTRNVGIKSVRVNGDWTTQIIFMDHDILQIPGAARFTPNRSLAGLELDEGYCFEDEPRGESARGIEGCLRRIYRVAPAVSSQAVPLFRRSAAWAFGETHRKMNTEPAMKKTVGETLVLRLNLWAELVRRRLRAARTGISEEQWTPEAVAFLTAGTLGPRMSQEWITAIHRNLGFLTRLGYLYEPE